MDKDRLTELVKSIANIEEQDTRLKQQLLARRRQLFLDLSEIFPIVQVSHYLLDKPNANQLITQIHFFLFI